MPKGIGIYIRQLSKDKHGTPEDAAQKAKDHGVSFVSIMTVWQEATREKSKVCNKPNTSKYADYVHAFIEANIEVGIWGYPWQGKESGFLTRITQAIDRVSGKISFVLLDPEQGYKWHEKMREAITRQRACALVDGTLDLLNESMTMGVTSYGQPKIHANFPWQNFVAGFGSPQFYTVGKQAIRDGMEQWKALGFKTLIPSVPAYGEYSKDLNTYLSYFDDFDIDGFIFWSWRQLNDKKWKVLERWASVF